MNHDDFFETRDKVKGTRLLSEAPEHYFVTEPAAAGNHVIRRSVNYGDYSVTRYSLGSWPSSSTSRVHSEYIIEGGYLPDPKYKEKYNHILVVTNPGSNIVHITCGDGRATYMTSFMNLQDARAKVQQELSSKVVVDKKEES
jgi:hypothetical protein